MSFLKSLRKFIKKYDPLFHYIDPLQDNFFLLRAVQKLFSPTIPKAGPAPDQVYSAALQNNEARIDDIQSIAYGDLRHYPTARSQPWFEYIGNDQYIHCWMRVTVGLAQQLDELFDVTPCAYFPDFKSQWLDPGQPMTLFHPNVYTNPQATNVELASGALHSITETVPLTFGPTGHPSRIDHDGGGGIFNNVINGSSVVISGAGPGYDGTYPVVSSNYSDETVDVSGATFTTATIPCTVTWSVYDDNDDSIKRCDNCSIVFNAANATATATPDLTQKNHDLSVFVISDLIIFRTAGVNAGIPFEIIDILGDSSFVLSPSPANDTTTDDILLLRRFHGAYDACPPSDTVDQVAVDLEWDQGLGNVQGDGSIASFSDYIDVQWREVDDSGNPLTDWTSFGIQGYTAATRTPVRRSTVFTLPSPCRPQLQLARTTNSSGGSDHLNHVNLMGVRGFVRMIAGEDAVYAQDQNSTTVAVSVRVSGVLAGIQDLKYNTRFIRKLEQWSAESGWSAPLPTRSIIWAHLDAMRGPCTAVGVRVPDSRIDLPTMAARAAQFDTAGLTFDGSFDSETTLSDAQQTILKLARAAPRINWTTGQYSIYVDERVAPVQMFTDDNSEISTPKTTLQNASANTGVLVSYQDPVSMQEKTVGAGDTDSKPLTIDVRNGCTTRQTAWANVAFYEWMKQLWRNQTTTLDTELEGVNAGFGDRVLIQSLEQGWGQSAEVLSSIGLTLTVSRPFDWSGAGWFCYLADPNGMPTAKISCTRGESDSEVILATDPGIELTGSTGLERSTPIAFGIPGNEPIIGINNGVTWSLGDAGGQQAQMDILIDDPNIYADPGTAPVDPYPTVSVTDPSLLITGLSLSFSGANGSASWANPAGAALYEPSWSYDQLNWNLIGRPSPPTDSVTFVVPYSGTVYFRVRARGHGARVGDYVVTQANASAGSGALAVTLPRSTLGVSTTGASATTISITANVQGGSPGYSLLWQKVSGDNIHIDSPTSQTTTFTANGLGRGDSKSAVFQLQATDSTSTVALSPPLTVTATNNYHGNVPLN